MANSEWACGDMGRFNKARHASDGLPAPVDLNSTRMMSIEVPETIDQNWVERQTSQELTRIIRLASSELKRRDSTLLTRQVAVPDQTAAFGEVPVIPLENYLTVPSKPGAALISKARTWHVLLISSYAHHPPLALKIVGDVVLGRQTEGVEPDVDLGPFEPALYGVSRTHAMIRPTADQLLLNDLGSTNGTSLNGDKLELSRAGNITDQSVITLGKLHFKVYIVRRPEDNQG